MSIELRFTAEPRLRRGRDIDGGDTVITTFPIPKGEVIVMPTLREWAIRLGCMAAASVNSVFHHGEFVVTSDPERVRTFGIMPEHEGCAECQAGVARALARLEDDPSEQLVVGRLYWAAPDGVR